jgi:hypothetical protein
MGARHAQIGDPRDFSDERCLPLMAERDATAESYAWGRVRGAFHGGYESGYESQLPADFWNEV